MFDSKMGLTFMQTPREKQPTFFDLAIQQRTTSDRVLEIISREVDFSPAEARVTSDVGPAPLLVLVAFDGLTLSPCYETMALQTGLVGCDLTTRSSGPMPDAGLKMDGRRRQRVWAYFRHQIRASPSGRALR